MVAMSAGMLAQQSPRWKPPFHSGIHIAAFVAFTMNTTDGSLVSARMKIVQNHLLPLFFISKQWATSLKWFSSLWSCLRVYHRITGKKKLQTHNQCSLPNSTANS
ncbi:hypothetical protein L6164_019321 [Bauhinia variegata]|uniref:Uncharacterized protein n=1 Tax=Bauhinia variegata TaxID=167791 RepID=A0ACB9MR22_BAUVA|nr:hypothetical protein L6164_019321 [Bauhinia variegata]